MARPWRIQYAGAGCHLMSRGIEGRPIFRGEPDFRKFLELLAEARERFHLELYSFALLTSHFHLVLRTLVPNVSRMMQWLQSVYVSHFNQRHKRRGHLLQARFKGIVIEDNSYLRTLSAYVHFNPVRAGMVDDPAKYPWTSYADYAGKRKRFGWIRREVLLGEFGRTVEEQRNPISQVALQRAGSRSGFPRDAALWCDPRPGSVCRVGEAEVRGAVAGGNAPEEVGQKRGNHRACRRGGGAGVPPERKRSDRRLGPAPQQTPSRRGPIHAVAAWGGVRNTEVGKRFGVGPAAVTEASKRLQTRMARDADLANRVARLEQRLDTVKPRGEKS